jgi:hypothetical protein
VINHVGTAFDGGCPRENSQITMPFLSRDGFPFAGRIFFVVLLDAIAEIFLKFAK